MSTTSNPSTDNTMIRKILITGATGKQGGAVLSSLLSHPPKYPFHLFALTRNKNTPRAIALASKPNVSLIQGDLDDVPSIFTQLPKDLYGVFSVQTPLKPTREEIQGKSLIDAASKAGVKHFIYTSAERGGPLKSATDSTPIAHFKSKFNIEKHLLSVTQQHPNMEYSIIRPVAFFDNLTPDFFGRVFRTIWGFNGRDTSLQFVSSRSIGVLGAEMFRNPDLYQNKAISFATDDISPSQADAIFKRVVGRDMPRTYDFLGRVIKWLAHEQLGVMFDWFKADGFGANPQEFRGKLDGMQDFEMWLRESSGWRDEIKLKESRE